MATVKDILTKLGKARSVSDELGLPLSTVTSWVQFNHVPDWRKSALLDLAVRKGVALSSADFPPSPKRIRKDAA
jgi:hypothetical protein